MWTNIQSFRVNVVLEPAHASTTQLFQAANWAKLMLTWLATHKTTRIICECCCASFEYCDFFFNLSGSVFFFFFLWVHKVNKMAFFVLTYWWNWNWQCIPVHIHTNTEWSHKNSETRYFRSSNKYTVTREPEKQIIRAYKIACVTYYFVNAAFVVSVEFHIHFSLFVRLSAHFGQAAVYMCIFIRKNSIFDWNSVHSRHVN